MAGKLFRGIGIAQCDEARGAGPGTQMFNFCFLIRFGASLETRIKEWL